MRVPKRLPIIFCSLVVVTIGANQAAAAVVPDAAPTNATSGTPAHSPSSAASFWRSIFPPSSEPAQPAVAASVGPNPDPSPSPVSYPQPSSPQNVTLWFPAFNFWDNGNGTTGKQNASEVSVANPVRLAVKTSTQSTARRALSALRFSLRKAVYEPVETAEKAAATPALHLQQPPPPAPMLKGHRATSLAERISATMAAIGAHIVGSIGNVASAVRNGVSDPPSVFSVNSSTIVAHVPTTLVGRRAGKVVVSHISINDGKLSMTVRSGNGTDAKEESVDFGLRFPSDVARVTKVGSAHAEHLSGSMTTLYITVKKMSGENLVGAPVIRALRPVAPVPRGAGHLEEDGYEFLESYMMCKKQFGGPSLKTSLCTCENQHSAPGGEELQTACVGRVVDRAYRIAHKIGEESLASKLYTDSFVCRQRKQGREASVKARNCLYAVLEKLVSGSKIDYQKTSGRKLMTAYKSDSVEEHVAAAKMSEEDAVKTKSSAHSTIVAVSVRILAVMAYMVGLAIILTGLNDIAAYYRRHRNMSHRNRHFDQLPDTARAMYSRFFG